jgi:hypothetical protein
MLPSKAPINFGFNFGGVDGGATSITSSIVRLLSSNLLLIYSSILIGIGGSDSLEVLMDNAVVDT